MLHSKTTTNDFNLPVAFRPFPHKGLADEYRANCFFSNYGPAASLGFPQMRQAVSWRPQNTTILLHGPISKHGIRSINVPREFARHRSLPARQPVKTLSYGHSIPYLTKHISRRQRKSRSANLRRLRLNPYIHCQRPLCQGRFRHQSSSRSIRSRLNNDRFMPVSISLGTVSQNQRSHQTSYITQPTRQYSRVHPYFRRKTARCQCSRYFNCSARFLLSDGSRLCRFRPSLYHTAGIRFFCNTQQTQLPVQKTLLASRGQIHRSAVRPNYHNNWSRSSQRLSDSSSANTLLRCRHRQESDFHYQQFRASSTYHCSTIQSQMAGGTVLQMDQAAPANQSVLRDRCQCGKDTSLDSGLRLCTGSDSQKKARPRPESLHYSTVFKCVDFRENTHFRGVFARVLQN